MESKGPQRGVPETDLPCLGRSPVVILTLLSAAIILGLAAWFHFRSSPLPTAQDAATNQDGVDELEAARSQVESEPVPVAPRTSVSVRRSRPAEATGPSGEAAREASDASAEAGQTIARLSQLEVKGPLNAEQAAMVKQDLQRLVAEGAAAVPAIQQFLKQNRDLSLDELKGSSPVGYGTLRAGMFDALRQIGGAQAQGTLADTLRTTADPGEIGLLARHLEEMAPGQFREEALNAARETLAQVAEGKSRAEVGPLFQILQNYGDASVVADLQRAGPNWQHYAMMALAGLPDGQGIPALVEQAQHSGTSSTANNIFAIQVLAQVASQYPDASAALVEQAKAGQIPDRAWSRIAEALAGDQYKFAKDPNADAATLMRTPGVKTYHINAPNENFYSLPLTADSAGDFASRRALIDQLLATTSNATATEALQKARAALSRGGR